MDVRSYGYVHAPTARENASIAERHSQQVDIYLFNFETSLHF